MSRWLALLVVVGLVTPAVAQNLGTDAERAAGKKLYDKFCAQCHGIAGDGVGAATPYLKPRPRDFTSGKYKIRTTPSGALPTDRDLREIIRRGMPYSSMPAWPQFSDTQLQNLAYYLKTFSEDFGNPEYFAEGMKVPQAPPMTEETIAQGRQVYEELGCIKCHGELGRGDGTSAPTLKDDWGYHIRAADLTAKWTFRGGATRADLFRTFTTGLNGTPMPSYADALSDEQRWHLVDYVYSISGSEEAEYSTLLVVKPVDEPIDPEQGAAGFEGAPEAIFPIVGQITQPGRNFHPLVTNIKVQAVHSRKEIAFLLRWNDLLADTSGTNDPAMAVPRFDPTAAAAPALEEDSGEESFWGDEEVTEDEESFWGDEEVAEDDFWAEEGDDELAAAAPTSEFSDAVAIQLPMQIPTGIQKPYFLFGDAERPVDLWFVDLGSGGVRQFAGRGSNALSETQDSEVTATASYDRGEWSVILRRPLRATEGVPFAESQFVPVAFSVWDGFNEERGNKRGLTQWVYLYVEPHEQVSAVGPMLKAGFGVLAVELLLIGFLRWRRRSQPAVETARVSA